MPQENPIKDSGQFYELADRLGDILVEMGALTPGDVEKIVQVQQKTGASFGQIAVERRFVSQRDVQVALSRQFNYSQLLDGDWPNVSKELVIALKPFERDAEIFRFLRGRILTSHIDKGEPCLAITGAENKVGTSYIAANLAVSLAQLGRRTLLLDTNLRRPRIRRIFAIETKFGLSEVLVGRVSPSAVIMSNLIENLSVLCAGNVPPNPQELLGGRQFKELFEELAGHYDVIIADTPGGPQIADATFVWSHCRNVLLVARRNVSSFENVQAVADMATECSSKIVGCVLNSY
ncbi:MAG: polysaccharide biosynthesis tyrosine autokinase [Alphaproteobacteria bacterium]